MNGKIKRGDIFWFDHNPYRPAVGSVQQPGRPGIVVSNDLNNSKSNTFEIIYLTTAPKKDLSTHCTIRSAIEISTALCEQITTVSNEQIKEYIGSCTKAEMEQVDACIAISLGLDFAPAANNEAQKTIDQLKKDLEAAEGKLAQQQKEYEELVAERDSLAATKAPAKESVAEEKKVKKLEKELVRAKAREELIMELYKELLNK